MKKENVYNESIGGDEGFVSGDSHPSCDGEGCDITTEDAFDEADILAGAAKQEEDAAAAASAAVAEMQDKYMRLQAEFDNYRKRTLKEKMDLVQTGGRDVLLAMLTVRDDVQHAMAAMQKSDDLEALRAGIELIDRKFTDTLRQKGVTEIEVKEKPFDGDTSDAVARLAAGEKMKDKVVEVIQTGYMLGDKVLRHAKVVVGE